MGEVDLSDLEEIIAEKPAIDIIKELKRKLENHDLGEYRLYFERNIDMNKDPYDIPWENAKQYEYWAGSIVLEYDIKKHWKIFSLGTNIPIIHLFTLGIDVNAYVNTKGLGNMKRILNPIKESLQAAKEIGENLERGPELEYKIE